MFPLRYFGDPVLKQRAREVEHIDGDLATIVHGMYETMDLEEGIGLAIQAMLVSPHFLFHIERDLYPADSSRVHRAGSRWCRAMAIRCLPRSSPEHWCCCWGPKDRGSLRS